MKHGNINQSNKEVQEIGIGNDSTDSFISDSSPGLFYSLDNRMDNGWIKSYRKVKYWQWYKKPGMFHLFDHLIREANHKDKNWQGILVKRGQLVTGRKSLSEETGISERRIRTCLERLQKTGELTIKTTNKFSIITIRNYDKYQNPDEKNDQQFSQQSTSNRPAIDHKQELKNEKNEKKKDNKYIYGEFKNVKLSKEEYQKLIDQFGDQGTKDRVESLSGYIASKGKKYKSHYATILTWERKNNGNKKNDRSAPKLFLHNLDFGEDE